MPTIARLDRYITISLLIILLFLISSPAQAYAPADMYAFKRILNVAPAPDGKQALIVTMEGVKKPKFWEWKYELYHREANNNLNLLTTESTLITQPTWSNDGKYLAYLTNLKSNATLWQIKLVNGQRSKLLSFNGSITSFKWSPDGKTIAFVGTPALPPPDPSAPIILSKQTVNARLYLLPLNSSNGVAITPTTMSVSPAFNDAGFDWSPDGQFIAFTWQSQAGAQYSSDSKIELYDLKTQQFKILPFLKDHYANQPLYSPDGKWLAYRSNLETKDIDTNLKNNIFYVNKICVINLGTLKNQCLADTDNQSPIMIGWNQTSKAIYAFDFYQTTGIRIYEMSLDGKVAPKFISTIGGFIEPLTLSLNAAHDTFGFGYETVTLPPEAYISPAAAFRLIPVSHFNKMTASTLGNTQIINWRSSDGKQVEGLLIQPKNYDPLKKYPLVVWLHGGPVGAAWQRYLGGCDEYSNMIEPTSCWGNYLNAGFQVLAPNYRGSTGYGADFRTANYRDLGGNDYQDIQAGVDYVVAKGTVDNKNIFIAGWSYGGYLTAWSIGQNTRYNAAVEGDGLTDLLSFAGTSDIPFYTSVFLGTMYWDDSFLYVKRSPIMYVKNIQTPLLILSGKQDTRVPVEQSLELYTALKVLHKPVEMIIFPDQGHVPTDANIALDAVTRVNAWFAGALRKADEASKTN